MILIQRIRKLNLVVLYIDLVVNVIHHLTICKSWIFPDKIYLMYHGTTSLENAALIEQNGFNASTGGLLGPGIYVSRNIEKAQQYRGDGVIFEVLVKVGRVCHIQDHLIPAPVGEKMSGSSVQRMIPAKDLVPAEWSRSSLWNDVGYHTAWVPHDCPDHVFTGGKGWNEGHKEETCVFDASRVTVLRYDYRTHTAHHPTYVLENTQTPRAHTCSCAHIHAHTHTNKRINETYCLLRS